MIKKPDLNAVIAYRQLCEEFKANQLKRLAFYEHIARESGNQETLKAMQARRGEYDK